MDSPPENTRINFEDLANRLRARAPELLAQWFPAGKRRGHEWVVGNLAGAEGESLSINIDTTKWADFATGEKGGDLIALYAAMHGVTQLEAARSLSDDPITHASTPARAQKPAERWTQIVPVPSDAPKPGDKFSLETEGKWVRLEFVQRWAYLDTQGRLIGYVCRFKLPNGDKHVVPQSFCTNGAGRFEWKWKSFPVKRPLYGLDELAKYPDRPVMVVEGEKAADAARMLAGNHYVVVTWPGGGKAIALADWRYLYGRAVILWPDADAPGVDTMRQLGGMLAPHCPEIKIIDVADCPIAWDAADAQASGWDWAKLLAWAKPRASAYKPADVIDLAERRREPTPPPPIDKPKFISQRQVWDELGLDLNGNGAPLANLNNALKIFEQHPECKSIIEYDEFHQKYFHRDGHEWSDHDELTLTAWMQRVVGVQRMPTAMVHDAAVILAKRHTRNEPRDWMDGLDWDGEERIEHFLEDAFGADGNEYTRAASRNFWVALVARVYRPGCRMRNVLVLESPQDLGKSTALSIIGGHWYSEASESVTNKDFFMTLQGKLLVEIAELDSFSRAEVTRIKQVISSPTDRFRPPYGRAPADFPRTCIFVGTTNEGEYLRDATGGTRFWPVKCGELRLDVIRDLRDQLFAEAVSRFKAGAKWWEMPRGSTEAEQEARRQADAWEDVIGDWLQRNLYTEVTVQQVMQHALDLKVEKQDKATQMRVASCLRVLGWARTVRRDGTKTARLWVRTERLL